jgi:hypothetical protein
LKLADDAPTANVSAHYRPRIDLPATGLKLSFWYRTDPPSHPFQVTVQHYDAEGRWMSGRNLDLPVEGSPSWRRFDQVIDRFPEGAKQLGLILRATRWREDGSLTGTVWFDEVSLVHTDSGKQLIAGGDFEPRPAPIPEPVLDFSDWDRAMANAIDSLHFNTFQVHVPGLGGGTFHARYEPVLLGFSEDTPQYQGAMKAYLETIEAHLREKGWLEKAFVYWFDEPDPKDYEFVMNGFAKLKRWAPDLRRMLTEQVEPDLIGGPNLWCPLSSHYDHEQAEARRRAGEQFWWYVCTAPKAPYCTLFIDHPGTELRVWLWQTWQRHIEGILVWQTNYWTSSAAYPDPERPQDPYADPMGWVSGYSTPAGTRQAWGNGDGRFLYPPEAAASGRPTEPVLDGPVSSIRLEMLRDGIEDYEYLVILRDLLEARRDTLSDSDAARYQALLEVPPDITLNMTTFTTDPEPIERRRREIARAIEQLSR